MAAAALLAVEILATPALLAVDRSSGCDSGSPGDGRQTLNVGGESRTYSRYTPSSYDNSTPYPLVFAFHPLGVFEPTLAPGIESWGELFCSGFYGNWDSTAGSQAIMVCPSALDHGSEGLCGGSTSTCYEWTDPTDDEFFDAMLADLASDYCVDLERVFVAGHSHGAFFANELACERGDDIRGLASIAGGGPFTSVTDDTAEGDCDRGKTGQVAAIVMHGGSDGTISVSFGQNTRDFWGNDNGCNLSQSQSISNRCARNGSDTHVTYQGCNSNDGYRIEWCLWDGVGHTEMFPIFPLFPGGGGENLAAPAALEFFLDLAGIPATAPLFDDGFESGTGAWDQAAGTLSTSTGGSPPEGSKKLEVDFDAIAAACSDENEEEIDTDGFPYVLGDASACVSVTLVDTNIAANATFTAGLSILLDNGASTSSGVDVELALDPSKVPFAWVQDDLSPALSDYHASFEINLADLDLDNGLVIDLFDGYDPAGELVFQLLLTRAGSENRLFLIGHDDDDSTQASTPTADLGSGWKTIEIAFMPGNGDGVLSLSIDGVAQDSLVALDNEAAEVGSVRLGYVDGDRGSTDGAFWLDDFQSWNSP